MYKKEDLRVKKTKSALNLAFSELMAEKTFEELSINELCVKAGVRRATFYKHFNDKNHFLREYVGSLRFRFDTKTNRAEAPGITAEYYIDYADRILDFIEKNSKIIDNAIKSNLLHIILDIITEKNYYDTCEKLEASVKAGMKLPASIETVSGMLTGGIATIICHWLFDGKKKDKSELSKELAILIDNVLKA